MIYFMRVPDIIQAKYSSWKSDTKYGRKQWIERARKSEEYYYNDVDDTGTTYTAKQYNKILETMGIPVSLNLLHPVCNQKLALLSQVKPSIKIIPRDTRAKNHAIIIDKMKHGVLYECNFNQELRSHIKDSIISGMGLLAVAPTNFYKKGMFGVGLYHIPYDEVILDNNSKKEDLSDMEGFFIEKEFTIPKFIHLYKHVHEQIKDEMGRPVDIKTFTDNAWIEGDITDKIKVSTTNYDTNDRIRVREYYTKVYTTMYAIINPTTGLKEYVFAENMDEDSKILLADAQEKWEDIYVKKVLLFGNYLVAEEILPITEYPIFATFNEWGGRPYRSYSVIDYNKDAQEAIDKLMAIFLLNGILSNNAGWTAPKGSIAPEDRSKWEEFGANPRVIKEYVPKDINGTVLKPEREKIEQIGNFYPMMFDMLKSSIEYSTGITAILQGNPKEANVEVFSSLQQYQNAAMMRVMMSSAQINDTLKRAGQVLVDYLIATIRPDTYMFFDDKGRLNELELVKDIINNFRSFRYTTAVTPATAMPTQRLAVSSELMKIAQSSPDPNERTVITQKAMELTDLREFDDVMEKIDSVKQANNKVAQLQEAYDRLMETSKQMENKYINSELENRILKKLTAEEAQLAKLEGELQQEVKNKKNAIKSSSNKDK